MQATDRTNEVEVTRVTFGWVGTATTEDGRRMAVTPTFRTEAEARRWVAGERF